MLMTQPKPGPRHPPRDGPECTTGKGIEKQKGITNVNIRKDGRKIRNVTTPKFPF
jgi:hypothetical protein